MDDYLNKLKSFPYPLIGVGITAFSRIGPGLVLPNYQLLCVKDTLDNQVIGKKIKVLSVEKDFLKKGEKVGKYNTLALLKNRQVQKYLASLRFPYLVLYHSTKKVERICDRLGLTIVANRAKVRDVYENKWHFKRMLQKIGLETIPNETFKIEELDKKRLEKYLKRWKKLVLILPELTKGGGNSLVFIKTLSDFKNFTKKAKKYKNTFDLKRVILYKFITGDSPSITGCITRHGVLTGIVQKQILDQPLVVNMNKGSGLYCGHDWSFKTYSSKIQAQAESLARSIGSYMGARGYRGIFGIDLIIDKETEKVYACECNPRYTGAFPVYSMLQKENKEPPFDVFHLLELLNINYQMNFDRVDRIYKNSKKGSHLILSNKVAKYRKTKGEIKAGVYQLGSQQLKFIREGFTTKSIKNPQKEFLLVDGVPRTGSTIRPLLRMGHLIFKKSILKKDGQRLKDEVKQSIRLIYKGIGF
ncbi:hypothetical protein COT75_04720 [Candidatus Beckwithbacteria bacterium CG10_big_fil_rev_8_21_14_0_10_34_10]|uniref:ATP-grasp domain-containing protein n=1 Tax=Candidatus Beckwithbacteria bacterium CG10_big_fil_rev_8_21_14_0_10_34_10 TaxID=1974495 RepID=A0A2H0W7Z7_9BACT|nr:MAG: hypothetical protein COT75_04720 [Candidatus Beckwithbacteria bacterium CG10_big_fil_rev_8_21_14_0_10_34_10]